VPDPAELAPEWSARCAFGEKSLVFHAKSPSGDVLEDDMVLDARLGSAKVEPLSLSPRQYRGLRSPGAWNACESPLVGIAAGANQALILFATNDRPVSDFLGAMLVDLVRGRVLDTQGNLADLDLYHLRLEKTPDGLRTLAVQGDRVHWHGRPASDGPEAFCKGWLRVTAVKGRIRARWEKKVDPDCKERKL
jgi:hypothetical protein